MFLIGFYPIVTSFFNNEEEAQRKVFPSSEFPRGNIAKGDTGCDCIDLVLKRQAVGVASPQGCAKLQFLERHKRE